MLTDYERYQLEWMIEHGHSLKEFVQGLDLVDLDGIDGLEDAYAIWEQDYGFGGEIFSNEREFNEEDAPALAAAERAPVSYQQAIAAALRKDGWSVIDDSPSPLLIISRESPTTGRTFSVTVSAKGDPDTPLTWLNGFKKLTEEDAPIRWKGGRDSYSTLLIGQDITHFKDGDVAAAVALVAETLGEVIRREGGVTLRDWYMQAYPEDPLGSKINPVVTFDDALSAVPTGGSFYDSIGIADSVARERIFEELCNRYGYSYDDIYDCWLDGKPLNADPDRALQRMRREAGYRSAADFAIAAGLSIPAYQSYERGVLVPPEAIVNVTQALAASGVQVDAWFAENGNRRPAWLTARTAPQQPEKIAVAAGRRFNLVDARDASGLDLDAEARDMRSVADGMTDRQLGTPSHGGQGR